MASRSSGFICVRRRDILGSWPGRRLLAQALGPFELRQRLTHHRDPRRAGRNVLQHVAPDRHRLLPACPSCCSRDAEEEARLEIVPGSASSARSNAAFASAVDHPIRFRHQRLAEIGLAFGACAIEPQRIAPRLHGIFETTDAHVDRADHLPAAAILGFFSRCSSTCATRRSSGRSCNGTVSRLASGWPGNCGEPSAR